MSAGDQDCHKIHMNDLIHSWQQIRCYCQGLSCSHVLKVRKYRSQICLYLPSSKIRSFRQYLVGLTCAQMARFGAAKGPKEFTPAALLVLHDALASYQPIASWQVHDCFVLFFSTGLTDVINCENAFYIVIFATTIGQVARKRIHNSRCERSVEIAGPWLSLLLRTAWLVKGKNYWKLT